MPSKNKFAGKAVIVTGSSRGIGRAAALAFAKLGASVTIHGQSAEKLAETKEMLKKGAGLKDGQIVSVLGPIQEEETAKELVEKTAKAFGRIDVLVNNAGIWKFPEAKDQHSLENFDYLFSVNVRSIVQLTALAAPFLAKTKGNVINVSSNVSQFPLMASMYYGMTKAALDHYTKDIANVLGQAHGIRVNSINPGLTESDFRNRFIGEAEDKKLSNSFCDGVIAKRIGRAEEIADVMTFLASPKAAYIWGAIINVDGGYCSFTKF